MAETIDPSQIDSVATINPDEIASVEEVKAEAPPTKKQSFERGLGQGASLGFSDEIGAAIDTALQGSNPVARAVQATREFLGPLGRHTSTPLTVKKTYEQRRDEERAANAAAQSENPGTYLGGTVLGALATPTPIRGGGLGAAIGRGALSGGLAGAGYSTGDLGQTLKDTGAGAVTGGITSGVLSGAGQMFQKHFADKASMQNQARQALQQYFSGPAAPPTPVTVNVPVLSHVGHMGVRVGEAAMSAGDKLLRKTMDAAASGNVRAKALLETLARTPEGAARIAGMTTAGAMDNSASSDIGEPTGIP